MVGGGVQFANHLSIEANIGYGKPNATLIADSTISLKFTVNLIGY
jgi:hypothetical protein